ncbi:MAG: hypothetical protein U9P49_04300 [Thermodesulfobacteriota bacterium]|nr:hypothetical protein [Thermodesulfobacteriota bacterium]
MNEKLNYHEVEVGQSSKGVWYCKSIRVSNSEAMVVKDMTSILIGDIEAVLKAYNEPEEKEAKEEK